MKKAIKIIICLVAATVLLTSCNTYTACPAYSDAGSTTTQRG